MMRKRIYRYWLYKITNIVNCKLYIGITTKENPLDRWKQHIKESKNKNQKNYTRTICHAIRKHGVDNFKFKVIQECGSLEELKEAEIAAIKYYDTYYGNGYNMTEGGDGTIGYKRPSEDCKPIGERMRLRVGDKNPFYGKTHTNEVRSLISETIKNAWASGSYSERIKNIRVTTEDQDKEIREKYATGQYSRKTLGEEYCVSEGAICRATKGIMKPKIKRKMSIKEREARRVYTSAQDKIFIEELYFINKHTMKEISKIINIPYSRVAKEIKNIKKEKCIDFGLSRRNRKGTISE